jgi:vacuolar-type H+-ATPase subunit C/Vma6
MRHVSWDDLNARARGLGARLPGRAGLRALAGARDLEAFARALEERGLLPRGTPRSAPAVERGLRAAQAHAVRTLGAWAGPRADRLAALFEDADRQSLRALFRGAAAGAPPDRRLAATLPTPSLPDAALEALSRAPGPADLARLLAARESPYARAVAAEAERPRPDLWSLELALDRTFARRALRSARRAGAELLRYVRDLLDLENLWTALALAGDPGREPDLGDGAFVEGGARLGRDAFATAIRAGSARSAAQTLAPAFAGTPLARALAEGERPASLDETAHAFLLRRHTLAARRRPYGPAPTLAFWLRLRWEHRQMRKILWGLALGAPADALSPTR